MKTKLLLFLTSLFFIFHTSAILAQYSNPVAPAVGTTSHFLLFTAVGSVANTGSSSIYAGILGINTAGSFAGFEALTVQPLGFMNSTSETAQCALDLAVLFNDLKSRPADQQTNGDYGGAITTLTPGIYNTIGAIAVTGNLILDGQGDPNARFIIRSVGALTSGATSKIILVNGTQAKNVYWVINGAIAIAANVEAKGIFLNNADISLGANCTIAGNMLTTTGNISTLDGMSLASPTMLLQGNQSINSGISPSDLVLINNNDSIVKWESASDINFTFPTAINFCEATLSGSCIGPLVTTTYFRAVVLIDGQYVHSNTIKISILTPAILPDLGPTAPFALFATAGAITSVAGTSTNNGLVGTNFGAITGGGYTNMSLLHIEDSLTSDCASYLPYLFNSLKAIPTTNTHIGTSVDGEILLPGVYQIAEASTMGGTITFDGNGAVNPIFVIKVTGALALAAGTKIVLTNGALASNIYWVIDGALGAGILCEFRGNAICLAGAIALGSGSITEGRLFSMAGALTLDNCILSIPVNVAPNQTISLGIQPEDLTLMGKADTVLNWERSSDFNFLNTTTIFNTTTSLSSAEMGVITGPTYFRAIVTNAGNTLFTNVVTVSIKQVEDIIPGIISSNQYLCSASQPEDLILSGHSESVIKWQSASDYEFTNPVDIANTTNTLSGADIGIVYATTFYRASFQNNCVCGTTEYTLPVSISVSTTTWDGTSWNNGFPTNYKSVVFAGDYIANEDIEACSITVNDQVSVIINSGFTVTLTNELNCIGGFLTFENNASLIQINEQVLNSGTITYKRESAAVRNSDYTYWSSPVTAQTIVAAFPSSPSNRIYSYDAFSTPENWKRETTSTIMSVGTGYILQGPQNDSSIPPGTYETSFYGKPNNGLIETPLGPEDTSNLLGNPYPSALDADTFLIANSLVLKGTIYLWTHATAIRLASEVSNPGSGAYAYSSDDYAYYNLVGGVAASSLPAALPTGKIAAGQAFFTTSKSSNAKALFNNTMRLAGGTSGVNNSQFFKITEPKVAKTVEKDRIWLNLSNSQGAFKQTLIGYVTGAINGYSDSHDAISFNGNKYVDFYSISSDKNLVIQGRAAPFDKNDEVPLGFQTTITGDFKISIANTDGLLIDQDVFIQDKLTTTIFNLKNGDYNFTTTAGTFDNRFVLLYNNKTLENNEFSAPQPSVLVTNKNKQIRIISGAEIIDKVHVYDISGKQIYKKNNVNDTEVSILELASSHQVLLVKTVLQNEKVVTSKILY